MVIVLSHIEPVSASARERRVHGGFGGAAVRGGGGAGLAAARLGVAKHSEAIGGGERGASLDVGGEEWEGLTLQDTPIRGVGVANSSLDREAVSKTSKSNSRPAPPGGLYTTKLRDNDRHQ